MPTTTNKQQILNQLFNTLKKRYEPEVAAQELPILEHLIYAICREEATSETADKAFRNLKTRFLDWNELRVSTVQEISEALTGLSDAGTRAKAIIGVLQEWFELTYSFNMDEVAKKGLKEGAKKISRLKEVKDYHVAWVIQHGFGGHAIPLDEAAIRVLRRLHVIEGEEDNPEGLRGSVEHYVPKARGLMFVELVSLLARDLCHADTPNCSACPLYSDCPTGIEALRTTTPEPKPRKSR